MIPDSRKEQCAITNMRSAVQLYASDMGISFEEAFFLFVESNAYSDLFDFSTELWKEGPDYLEYYFRQSLANSNH